MKARIAIALVAILFFFSAAQAKKWYEGGTLHKAKISQFLQADEDNQLASIGDLVAATLGEKESAKITMTALLKGSEDVRACVIKATEGVAAMQNQKVNEIALLCMTQLKKDYPWMLTKF